MLSHAATVRKVLSGESLCTLATCGPAGLTCGTMFYGFPADRRIALLCSAQSRQVANIEETGRCTVVVVCGSPEFGRPVVQVRADCSAKVAKDQHSLTEVFQVFEARFPGAATAFAGLSDRNGPISSVAATVIGAHLLNEPQMGIGGSVFVSGELLSGRFSDQR